jgi:hypothetical protein
MMLLVLAHILAAQRCCPISTAFRQRQVCWPHLVLSAHAHNYQRFTRTMDSTSVQYVVVGTSENLSPVRPAGSPPADIAVRHFDSQHFGYLRLTANRKQLHVDFQAASGDASIADTLTLDLESRKLAP